MRIIFVLIALCLINDKIIAQDLKLEELKN